MQYSIYSSHQVVRYISMIYFMTGSWYLLTPFTILSHPHPQSIILFQYDVFVFLHTGSLALFFLRLNIGP